MSQVITLPETLPTQRQLAASPNGPRTPYLVLDLAVVRRQFRALRAALPDIAIHYAVKCNPHPRIISALAAEGCNFEIASATELDLLLDAGAAETTLLYSNPVKSPQQISYAYTRGVRYYAADCADEIDKLAALAPGAGVVVRVDVSNKGSVVPLSGKFGADPADVPALLLLAEANGLVAHGLTFHVGSQALDPNDWRDALVVCGAIMRQLLDVGIRLALVDIGGGFPVPYGGKVTPVTSIGLAVRAGLESLPYAVAVAAEPGRFLTAEAGVMVAGVIGRASRRGKEWLHLDIGAFGGLMEALETRRGLPYPITCTHAHETAPRLTPMSITGPTCDSEDTILNDALVCAELRTGDVVTIGLAGAYTTAYASTFNGFPLPSVITRELVVAPAARGIAQPAAPCVSTSPPTSSVTITRIAPEKPLSVVAGTPDLTVSHGLIGHFQFVPVLPAALLDEAWSLYLSAFEVLRTQACQRHVLYRHEFDDTMADARIIKVLGFDGPILTSLAIRTTDLDAVPLISPEFYEARYPRQYAGRTIFYIGFIAVLPGYQRSGAFLEQAHALMNGIPADAVIGADISGIRKSMHLDKAFARAVRAVSAGTRIVYVDTQSYYVYDLSPVD